MPAVANRIAAADQMNLAVEDHGGRGAALRRDGSEGAPAVLGRVILVCIGHGVAILLDEAAEGVDFAVESYRGDVVEAARHRGPAPPRIGDGVELVIERLIDAAVRIAAEHVYLVAGGRDPDFRTRNRQRRLDDPAARTGGRPFRASAEPVLRGRGTRKNRPGS